MDMFDLTGKVAIITDSSRGTGRAIAEAYADAGARVVISSRKLPTCSLHEDVDQLDRVGRRSSYSSILRTV
jgi:NAD(P)-dependent dehydrogenase (short-subunit alcohol dehydrogenase family)